MKASVIIITYNQEKFISKAIDGILFQETNFEFELIIGEDCSKDNTRNICLEYQKKIPNKIRVLLNEKNKGIITNLLDTINECKGEYIAVCAGDDYWTDPLKLKKQVDFLDNNPDCSFCYTNCYLLEEGNLFMKNKIINTNPPEKYDLEFFLINSPLIPASTKVFRKSLHPDILPEWFKDVFKEDWVLNILHAENGKIGYLDCITGYYRIHSGGNLIYTTKIVNWKKTLLSIINLKEYFKPKFEEIFNGYLELHYRELAFSYLSEKFYFLFFKNILDAIKFQKKKRIKYIFNIIKRIVKLSIGRI